MGGVNVSSNIKRSKDTNGNIIYPITSLDAVYYADDLTVKQYVDSLTTPKVPIVTASAVDFVKLDGTTITIDKVSAIKATAKISTTISSILGVIKPEITPLS